MRDTQPHAPIPTDSRAYGLRARWVFPGDREPIENGTVVVEDGRIVDIHDRHDPAAVDLGHAAILPGLVNTHTHLEFSDLPQPIQPSAPFTDWIRQLVAHRRGRAGDPGAIVRQGLHESARHGTTLIGEIATEGWSPHAWAADCPRTVVFRELIGFQPEQIPVQLAAAREHLERADRTCEPRLLRGLSPHAPYSVHPDLFHGLVELAAEFQAPAAVHLAETRAELEFLAQGTGEFARLLDNFAIPHDGVIPHGSRPLDYLEALARLDRVLVVHGNYLSADEIDFLAGRPQFSVVYCPRTHAYFGHEPHPWRELLERDVNVSLGTDSRGSNPDLSVWRELLSLHRSHPEVAPRVLLRLGTLSGARALGLEAETGSLSIGKSADLAILPLPPPQTVGVAESDPFALLFCEAFGGR
jgi:aminodeoxyfutalosine deaminase